MHAVGSVGDEGTLVLDIFKHRLQLCVSEMFAEIASSDCPFLLVVHKG
jgi:hypothetical protein